ncbi:MAG: tetratricopeptide repeat protein, partial [Roseburia sp.]|nr:tetratricopeptide repeat protein [Roseburia sp.]
LLGLKSFNRLPEGGDQKMGHLLIDGYNYFMTALPLDSVPDAKGKIKPKYSKEMVNTITGHFNDYVDAGANLYNTQDYMGAYQAWDIFTTLPDNPTFAGKLTQHPDSVYGEILFNQGIAAWQSDSLGMALNSFMRAKDKGYRKKNLYDYAISIASQLGRNDTVLTLSQEALPMYGQESDLYIRQIINHYLQARDFDRAFEIINNAIAAEPNNAQYYVIQGVLYENNENKDEAIAAYRHAIELDANNADALFNLGRQLCDKAFVAADAAPTTEAEYIPYAAANITPYFAEAADILERAFTASTANPDSPITADILNYLENVYYNLHDETKLNDVKERKRLY